MHGDDMIAPRKAKKELGGLLGKSRRRRSSNGRSSGTKDLTVRMQVVPTTKDDAMERLDSISEVLLNSAICELRNTAG